MPGNSRFVNAEDHQCTGRRGWQIAGALAVVISAFAGPRREGDLLFCPSVQAAPLRKPTPAERTTISLTILISDSAAAFQANTWTRTLRQLGISFRIRSRTAADRLEIRETKYGTFRKVSIVGMLDRRGRLVFKDRVFSRGDSAKLAEWIRELKTYGAQGTPQGKPLWGLTKSQFGEIYTALSKTVDVDVKGQPLEKALPKLSLPAELPWRFSVAARRLLAGRSSPVQKFVKGHSRGTALALILRDAGLGFRPLRTPSGSVELVIDPLSVAKDAWPVGWKPKLSRPKTAPSLFVPGPVSLENVKLVDIFHAVSVKTGIPVHVDYYAAARHRIDVNGLRVSYPPRKVSSSVLLRDLCALHKLSRELRIDERGTPFVWVTVFVPKPLTR